MRRAVGLLRGLMLENDTNPTARFIAFSKSDFSMNDETVLRMLSDALWNEGHAIVAVC
jgi:hypothetical protein